MKVCYTGGAVKDCGSYYSVATNAVELRIWFLTDGYTAHPRGL